MLKVNTIFKSIQGESSYVGLPCAFVRLTGCHLRCSYCDTKDAYYEGKELSVDEVLSKVGDFALNLVEITGGEPLIQKETFLLAKSLVDDGNTVLIETSGTVDLSGLDRRVVKIMDIKCPGSGVSQHMCWTNLDLLNDKDEIKFVIGDREDFDWAEKILKEHDLKHVLFSPVFGKLEPSKLSQWILSKNLPVRMQVQLHKYIFPNSEQ